ncbi:MAG: TatA/E family twin arginine-targeting protein translocase [Phormidesmis sp.]
MNIFGIGLPEMGLIMIVALLVFGPKKLPEIGRSMGKALKGFQDASKEFETEFKKEADRIEKSVAEPMKATLEKPRAFAPDADSAPTEAKVVKTTTNGEAAQGETDEKVSPEASAETESSSDQAA